MFIEVINVLCPFLGFPKTSFQEKTHMMFMLMFNPHFKGMDSIMDHTGRN